MEPALHFNVNLAFVLRLGISRRGTFFMGAAESF